MLTGVLDAVSAVNSQLLEALTECARSESAEFPLDKSLRARVARLTLDERQRAARCGVFLADANFVEFACWREVALEGETTRSTELLRAWLPIEESRSLANSVLLVAWYLIHANPAVARVLLGMSASGVVAYRELSIADLAHVARQPSRVGPAPLGPSARRMAALVGGLRRRERRGSPIDDAPVPQGEYAGPQVVVRICRAVAMMRRLSVPVSRNRKEHHGARIPRTRPPGSHRCRNSHWAFLERHPTTNRRETPQLSLAIDTPRIGVGRKAHASAV